MDCEASPPCDMWMPSSTRKNIVPPPSTAKHRGMNKPRVMLVSCSVQVLPLTPVTVARALKKFGITNQARLMENRIECPPVIAPFTKASDGSVASCWFVSAHESRLLPRHQ